MPELLDRPPIALAPLSVVLTVYNAGPELDEVAAAWFQCLEELARPCEVVLVDDGSEDGSAARAEQLLPRYPQLRVLRHPEHRGLGAALRTGIQACQYPLVFTTPCDKQFQPPDLQQAFANIDKVDLVLGYRVAGPLPWWLRVLDGCGRLLGRIVLGLAPGPRDCWLGWAGWRRRWLARWLFGLRVQDPECPYRLYRREIFRRIPIQAHSSAALIEILAKANHLECIMAEVPVSWVPPKISPADPVDKDAARELRRLFFSPDFGPALGMELPMAPLDFQI